MQDMKCSNCGHEMKANEKFCIKCGLSASDVATEMKKPDVEEVSADLELSHVESNHESVKENTPIGKVKETVSSYWVFVRENLKAPIARAQKSGPLDFVYGYITIGIISLLLALGGYIKLSLWTSGWSDFFGYRTPFFETFFTALFYGVIGFLAAAGVVFAVLKLMFGSDVSFHSVLGRFGSLLTVPLACSVLFFISSFTGVDFILGFVTLLLLCILQAAIILTFYSFVTQTKSTTDSFYGIVVIYGVFALLIGLTADTFFRYFMFSF